MEGTVLLRDRAVGVMISIEIDARSFMGSLTPIGPHVRTFTFFVFLSA